MKRTLGEFARACGGRLEGADRSYTAVSTDSRTIGAGELFVALHGPNFDGNQFVGPAQAAGAAGAVVDTASPSTLPQIVVEDTLGALSGAAAAWRKGFDAPVIGVAGSNGKTTAKEMISGILSQAGECLATRGNLNNHIGVPLTLLRLEPAHRFAVIEMGANRAGDLEALVALARPGVGLITNAGAEHLEGFGSLEGAARAEGEMVAGLAPGATAVINADDEFAPMWRNSTRARVVTFGLASRADFTARNIRTTIGPRGFATQFTLAGPRGETPIELRLAGRHNVSNALAAAAAASAAGATPAHIAAGLASLEAVKGRLQFKVSSGGAWIIDDSYNANPSSVRAGIDVLAELEGRRWLVLGDMAELGAFAAAAHREAGAYARDRGVERLFTFGKLAALAAESFGGSARSFADPQSLSAALEEAGGDVRILIKGSRMNRLERVVDALTAQVRGREAG